MADIVEEDESEKVELEIILKTSRLLVPSFIKAWVLIVMWFILAPVAHRWDLGPLYLQLAFVSFSSIWEDFRELPGTLNADRFDRDIRAGQF
ncbi:hypothetical protein P8452_22387 [Trifolium repens]|nr:hypothetical protein P8452_22387 [Trifolium repens]